MVGITKYATLYPYDPLPWPACNWARANLIALLKEP